MNEVCDGCRATEGVTRYTLTAFLWVDQAELGPTGIVHFYLCRTCQPKLKLELTFGPYGATMKDGDKPSDWPEHWEAKLEVDTQKWADEERETEREKEDIYYVPYEGSFYPYEDVE